MVPNANEMKRVEALEVGYDAASGLYLFRRKPFCGVRVSRYPGGAIKAEMEIYDGLMHGKDIEYGSSGVVFLEGHYAFGLLHGSRRRWNKDGILLWEEKGDHGFVINRREYSPEGSLVASYDLTPGEPGYDRWQQRRLEENWDLRLSEMAKKR